MTTALARPDRFGRRLLRKGDTLQLVRSGRADLLDTLPTIGPVTISALPQPANLLIYQGDTFFLFLTVFDPDGQLVPLDQLNVLSQIRAAPADTDLVVLAEFTASTANDRITLMLSHQQTTPLHGQAVWDCQVTDPNGWVTTLAAGTVTVTPEVTR